MLKVPTLPTADSYTPAPTPANAPASAPTDVAPIVVTPATKGNKVTGAQPPAGSTARIPGPWELKIPTTGVTINEATQAQATQAVTEHLGGDVQSNTAAALPEVAIDFGALMDAHQKRSATTIGPNATQTPVTEVGAIAPAWATATDVPTPPGVPVPQHADIAQPAQPPAPGPVSPFAAPKPQPVVAPQAPHLAQAAQAAAKAAAAHTTAAQAMTTLARSMGNLQTILGEGFVNLIKQAGLDEASQNQTRCDLGMGCNETGMCYAMAMNAPERCGMPDGAPDVSDQPAPVEQPLVDMRAMLAKFDQLDAVRHTTECHTCGGGTGQAKPCDCAVQRQDAEQQAQQPEGDGIAAPTPKQQAKAAQAAYADIVASLPKQVKSVARHYADPVWLPPQAFATVGEHDKHSACSVYKHLPAPADGDIAALLPDLVYMWFHNDGEGTVSIQCQGVATYKNAAPASGRGRKPVPNYVMGEAITIKRMQAQGQALDTLLTEVLHEYMDRAYSKVIELIETSYTQGVIPAYVLYRGQGTGYVWSMAPQAMCAALPMP